MDSLYQHNLYYNDNKLVAVTILPDDSTPMDYTVYEVVRLMITKPLFLEDHIARLDSSLKALGLLNSGFNVSDITHKIKMLCLENKLEIGNIELRVNIANNSIQHTLIGFVKHAYPNPIHYVNGVDVCTLIANRTNPNLKIKGLVARELADTKLAAANCYEALLVNEDNCITEGSRSNVFFISGRKIITAPDSLVLKGISRKYVLSALHRLKFNVVYKAIAIDDLQSVDAAFVCGTSPGVLPLRFIDGLKLDPSNKPLREIMMGFNQEIQEYLSRS